MRLMQIWMAWALAFFLCIATPAQAMSASKALANPLATGLDTSYYPINHTDPSGLEPVEMWPAFDSFKPGMYSHPEDTYNLFMPLLVGASMGYAAGEIILGTAGLISVFGPTRGLVAAGSAYQSETAGLIMATQGVPSNGLPSTGAAAPRSWKQAGIAPPDATRIQGLASKYKVNITVVGSRASGTATATSDWDYIISGANARARGKVKSALPRGASGGALTESGHGSGVDFFPETDVPKGPYVEFRP